MNTNSTVRKLPIEQRVFLHGALVAAQILPTCGNCIHCEAKPSDARAVDAYCTKYNAFPPLEIVIQGCVGWEEEIPF